MGGGAGAGHANNGGVTFNYGGNGGGIVFIWANNLNGNGNTISARGGKGGDSQADGTGGGGAGGTIIMHVGNYTGSATISVNGGNGGDSFNDNSIVRCFGGGGGGSGGTVYFTGATPGVTVSISGGAGGQEFNRNTGCNAPVPGVIGSSGQIIPNYTFSRSTDPAGYCRLLLPVKLISFSASYNDKKVLLEWEIDNPADVKRFIVERSINGNQWVEVKTIPGNDQYRNYSVIDENPMPGKTFYRIKFIEKNNALSYSPVRQVRAGKNNEFIVYPNPAKNKIFITGNFNYPASLKLLDLSGKIIFQKNLLNSPATIDLPHLSAGIYFLQVNEVVHKLVIR